MTEDGVPIAPALSAQQVLVLWASPKASVGAWTTDFTTLAPFALSDGAQNSSVSYDFICTAGTYTVDFTHLVGPNRGIYAITIDDVAAFTVDGYASGFNTVGLGGGVGATSTAPTLTTTTGVVFTSGTHVLKFKMATKNASSSGYYGCISQAVLTKAG